MRLRTEDGELMKEGGSYWALVVYLDGSTRAHAVTNPIIDGKRVRFQGVGLGGGGTARILSAGVAVGVYASREALDRELDYVNEMEWTIAAKESTNGKA